MHTLVVKPAGSMMRLKCPSVGNPRPNITWLKNNEEPKRDIGSVSKTKWTLRLEDLVTKDSGNYTCIVCNYLGCINYTFKVDIIGEYRWYGFPWIPLASWIAFLRIKQFCVTSSLLREHMTRRTMRTEDLLTKPQSVSRISHTSTRTFRRTWPLWLTVPRSSDAPLSPILNRLYSGLKSPKTLVIKRIHHLMGLCYRYIRHLSRWWWWRVLGPDFFLFTS